MEEIPKIVSQRLKSAPAGPHLDPNLLVAFAEKSLHAGERDHVLEHLAQCGDCREVAILSMPEFETQVAPVYTPSRWLGWPVLRWGALATCVVIVGAAVSLRHEWSRSSLRMQTETTEPARMPAAETPVATEMNQKRSGDADQQSTARRMPSKSASDVVAGGAAKQPKALQDQVGALSGSKDRPGTPAAVPPTRTAAANATPTLAKADQVTPTGDEAGKEKDERREQQTNAYSRPASEASATARVSEPALDELSVNERKKSGATAKSLSTQLMQAENGLGEKIQGQNAPQVQSAINSMPQWALTTEGTLQRSIDAGKTWQAIPVSGKTAFRAVAAAGADVWVGGDVGALYHSADGGEHWVQVKPSVEGLALTADIIGVEFKDAAHGKLTTANKETWTTIDSGQTWQRQ